MPHAISCMTLADEVVDVAASGEIAVRRAGCGVTNTAPKSKAAGSEKGDDADGPRKPGAVAWKVACGVISMRRLRTLVGRLA